MHFNMSGTAVNAECIVRQYALDKAIISDPNQKIPVLTIELLGDIADWSKTLSTPLTYGKMESSAGGAGTYSGLRPKTGRKKKAVAAAAGSRIEDMADGVEVEAAAPTPKKSRKRTKKGATDEAAAVEAAEEIVSAPILADADPDPSELDEYEAPAVFDVEEPVTATEEPAPTTAEDRAERRRQRKALLAGKA
jgi:hypothetical protein